MSLLKISTQYTWVLRDIRCISYVLLAFVAIFGGRVAYLLLLGESAWPALGTLATSLSALLVVKNVQQSLLRGDLQRADDRRLAIVRVTHHLMLIVGDMRNHANFLKDKAGLMETTPSLVYITAAETIVDRYEALLDREIYQYLPGPSVKLVENISAWVLGLKSSASVVTEVTNGNLRTPMSQVFSPGNKLVEHFDSLIADLNALDSAVRMLRNELEEEMTQESAVAGHSGQ